MNRLLSLQLPAKLPLKTLSPILACLLLLGLPCTMIAATDFQSDYQAGLESFRLGDYAAALNWFQSAQTKHPEKSGHLSFNLGSSYYKLGRYQEAYDAFTAAATDPRFYVLSQINLALCAAKLDDRQRLATHLLNALALAQTQSHKQQLYDISQRYGFSDLYDTQLRRLGGNLRVSLGYDKHPVWLDINGNTNSAAQTTNGAAQQKSASYLSSDFNLEYNPSRYTGISAEVSDIRYEPGSNYTSYDYRRLELKPRLSLAGPVFQGQLYLGHSWSHLGDRKFQSDAKAGLLLGWTLSTPWQIKLALHYQDHASQDIRYQYLSGHEIDRVIGLSYLKPDFRVEAEYGRQSNDRADYYEGQSLSQSYSPQRWYGGLNLQVRLRATLWLSSALQYRKSHYHTPQHTDRRWLASAGLLAPLSPVWSAHLSYQRFDNRSSASEFVYDTYHILTGLGYRF